MLKLYFNLMALEDCATAPGARDPERLCAALRESGYQGVQFVEPLTAAQDRAARNHGLGRCGLGRVNRPEEAGPLAGRLADEGMECATLHVGWGGEDDDQGARLLQAVLAASERFRIPLHVETHRATLFQDLWRTVQFVKRFPDLTLNGDFSHWYTGLEMVYGGFDQKLRFIEPVFERIHFVHGRIGSPGCMQVALEDLDAPYVGHFRELWRRSFAGKASMYFVPELLSPRIYYARSFQGAEEGDRWRDALTLCGMARECWDRVQGTRT
ncbi:MAG TPA: hypothetical protein DEH78_24210 [Solibacterales bacterium]|nr:hypothetical protein [Bryobacterales bacterium]